MNSTGVGPDSITYRHAETYLFDTCSMRCGYCWLAETGLVADGSQLARFRDLKHIDRLAAFFNSRTTSRAAWILELTGGEPLLMPNLDRFCDSLFEHHNKIVFYTSLFVPEKQRNLEYLINSSPADVDYIMASFHPEAEADEERWFKKLLSLKRAGHKVFLRFVGHPTRLGHLRDLSKKCEEMDVCLYATPMLSNTYPGSYTTEQRAALAEHFVSLSQFIQLAGGIDTSTTRCFAGSRVIAVNLQTGNITPCISVHGPSLGNIFEDRLSLYAGSINCPEKSISCLCDVHYQQDIIEGVADSARFYELKQGFHKPISAEPALEGLRRAGIGFYPDRKVGIGGVRDDLRLFYSDEEVRNSLRRLGKLQGARRAFPASRAVAPLIELDDFSPYSASVLTRDSAVRIETGSEQWGYAAWAAIPARRLADARQLVVTLDFVIEKGKLGIGCVGEDHSTYVGDGESIVSKGDSHLRLNLDSRDGAAGLVIRNVSDGRERSIMTLKKVETFAVESVRIT